MNEEMDPLLLQVTKGVHAAAIKAIDIARRHGTQLVIWRDGKVVQITPDEAEAMLHEEGKQ